MPASPPPALIAPPPLPEAPLLLLAVPLLPAPLPLLAVSLPLLLPKEPPLPDPEPGRVVPPVPGVVFPLLLQPASTATRPRLTKGMRVDRNSPCAPMSEGVAHGTGLVHSVWLNLCSSAGPGSAARAAGGEFVRCQGNRDTSVGAACHHVPVMSAAAARRAALKATLALALLGASGAGCVRPSATARAQALVRQGHDDEAVATLKQRLAAHPDDVPARRLLIRLLGSTGDIVAARAEVEELAKRVAARRSRRRISSSGTRSS